MGNEAIGHLTTFGYAPNANAWATTAKVLGAGHGVEVDQNSLKIDSQYIENMGVSGNATQLPGVKGNELVSGSFGPADFYYQGLERLLYPVFGAAAAPVQQAATTAYLTTLTQSNSRAGIYGTAIEKSDVAVKELPFVKVDGLTVECEQGKQAKITVPFFAYGVNFNIGSPIANRIVAAVTPTNTTLTIANQPTEPSPISFLITDGDASITEYVVTVIGTDRDNNVITDIYRKTLNGLSYKTPRYYKTVTSVVGSGLTGSTAGGDTIQVGVTNGENNASTVGSITLPSARDPLTFAQMQIYINDQSAAALDSTFVKYIQLFRFSIALGQKQSVTSKAAPRIDEPFGDAFVTVTGGFNFDRWNDTNHDLVKDYLSKGRKKMKVEWIGPIASSPFAYRVSAWFNNVVFTEGNPELGGPGQTPLDMQFKAQRALSLATGFPASATGPVTLEVVNTVSTQWSSLT